MMILGSDQQQRMKKKKISTFKWMFSCAVLCILLGCVHLSAVGSVTVSKKMP